MTTHDILSFTVIAAVVTGLSNLIALYFKDYLGARSFERWKANQSLIAVYNKYRKPISLAAQELGGRCYALSVNHSDGPRDGVGLKMLREMKAQRADSAVADEHFFRYRFVSDVYRLCCFLGWIELYRRDLGLLDAGAEVRSRELDACLQSIRSDLADGQLNTSADWDDWVDALLFREEQRAVGHRMVAAAPAVGLIDFGTFSEQLEGDLDGVGVARWFVLAARLFNNLQDQSDFRLIRMQRLVVHLTELRELLQPGSVWPQHLVGAKKLAQSLVGGGYLRCVPALLA